MDILQAVAQIEKRFTQAAFRRWLLLKPEQAPIGACDNKQKCPLANFLNFTLTDEESQLISAITVEVEQFVVHSKRGRDPVFVQLKSWARKFINQVDNSMDSRFDPIRKEDGLRFLNSIRRSA
jgi:hypothetical protein